MNVLENIGSPADLRQLAPADLRQVADELRERLVASVCRTGGHLGPNLGVVELTLALHRVFDSPHDPIVFDTGHQSYVHKMLTGRQAGFAALRKADGLSGYPSRAESVHDVVENSHASTALAYADGLAKAFTLSGEPERCVVVVVGDGALTGGLSWEALNNLGRSGRRVVVVLNDNGRSYSPTIGGLAQHLARLRDRGGYAAVQDLLGGTPTRREEPPLSADGLFAELGFGYLGPVDGHDLDALEAVLAQARGASGPVVVHALTVKGRGYAPAEQDEADRFHTVGVVERDTGKPAAAPRPTWTHAFSDALVGLGETHPDVVAISAAMLGPTGLQQFADRYPDRCFDVGIAEQHALTSAAALAMGGRHPVVAVYATFANRAFDQTMMDVGLHRQPVTLVLDRAGITGPDGPSHHGMWDLAMLGIVPGMRIAAPRDAATLAEELAEAVAVDDGPTALRFPKASLGAPVEALERRGGVDVLRTHAAADVLLLSVGALAAADAGLDTPVRPLGLPTEFLPHGSRAELLTRYGLDGHGIATYVKEVCGQLSGPSRRLRLVQGRGGAS